VVEQVQVPEVLLKVIPALQLQFPNEMVALAMHWIQLWAVSVPDAEQVVKVS